MKAITLSVDGLVTVTTRTKEIDYTTLEQKKAITLSVDLLVEELNGPAERYSTFKVRATSQTTISNRIDGSVFPSD